MRWRNLIDDPIPALLVDAWLRAVLSNSSPCSGCNASIEKLKDGAERIHFHASDCGACARRTQLSMMFPLKVMFSNKPEFLRDGHVHEAAILALFREGSADPKALDETIEYISISAAGNNEEIFQRIPYKDTAGNLQEYVIVGHWDGLLSISFTDGRFEEYLLECKAVKDTTFNEVKSGEISAEWYGQVQVYLNLLGLKRAYLIVKNRTTAEVLPPIRIDFNQQYMKERRQVLAEIHERLITGNGLVDREHTSPDDFECTFCKFHNKCWGLNPKRGKANGKNSKSRRSQSKAKDNRNISRSEEKPVPVLQRKVRRTRNDATRKKRTQG